MEQPGVEIIDIDNIRKQNSSLLQSRVVSWEQIFERSALLELQEMAQAAQSGEILANEVVAFINPGSRYSPPGSTTAFGLGYIFDQGLRLAEDTIAGVDKKQLLPMYQNLWQSFETILNAVGLPDPHILKRNVQGDMEHLPFPITLDVSERDLVDEHIGAAGRILDYFENLFEPADVIAYCQRRLERVEAYVNGGINVRTLKPLSEEEIGREQRRANGFREAIERNQSRK